MDTPPLSPFFPPPPHATPATRAQVFIEVSVTVKFPPPGFNYVEKPFILSTLVSLNVLFRYAEKLAKEHGKIVHSARLIPKYSEPVEVSRFLTPEDLEIKSRATIHFICIDAPEIIDLTDSD